MQITLKSLNYNCVVELIFSDFRRGSRKVLLDIHNIYARERIFSIITIRGSLRRTNTVERKKNFELENFISTIFDIVFNLKNDNSLQEYSFA